MDRHLNPKSRSELIRFKCLMGLLTIDPTNLYANAITIKSPKSPKKMSSSLSSNQSPPAAGKALTTLHVQRSTFNANPMVSRNLPTIISTSPSPTSLTASYSFRSKECMIVNWGWNQSTGWKDLTSSCSRIFTLDHTSVSSAHYPILLELYLTCPFLLHPLPL